MTLSKLIKRIIVGIGVVLALLIATAYWLLHTETPRVEQRSAPLVPRLAADYPGEARVADTRALLGWAEKATPLARVNTATDTLPNGLALSMLPFLVDWQESHLDGKSPFVLVRNVNAGGNPLTGENLLATARVPLDGVAGLEWCLTPTRNRDNRDTFMGHAMLRFLFDPERRPTILGRDGAALSGALRPDDLMLSWEAWRPAMTRYDGLKGLDPETYTLTARAYTGAQRFLTDVIRGNPWRCYPVKLPEVDDALKSTLLTALLSGDAFARRIIGRLVAEGVVEAEGMQTLTPAQIERARQVFSAAQLPDDPLSALMGKADLSYQLLERSCITESLAMIQLALIRIHDEHDLGPAPRMQLVPDALPGWIQDLAEADHETLLAHVPGALLFVANNQQVLPINAYRILEDAGLLHEGESGPVVYYYDKASGTPYGDIRDNLM